MQSRDRVIDGGSSEARLIAAARRRDEQAVREIVRAHNRMLFRLARSILPSDDEAEDAVQAAYVRAFTAFSSFRGDSRLGTWLGRIVINEALRRARSARPSVPIDAIPNLSTAIFVPFPGSIAAPDPERTTADSQVRRILEGAIDELPQAFRTVLVARLVEEMSVEETAAVIGIRPETVKTRLHRARTLLRAALEKQFGAALADLFSFGGERCERLGDRVVAALSTKT